ncbi:hypothetical protein [Sphingomonas sp.]
MLTITAPGLRGRGGRLLVDLGDGFAEERSVAFAFATASPGCW